jgi:hypothetical protein
MHIFKCLEPHQGGSLPLCRIWSKQVQQYGNTCMYWCTEHHAIVLTRYFACHTSSDFITYK